MCVCVYTYTIFFVQSEHFRLSRGNRKRFHLCIISLILFKVQVGRVQIGIPKETMTLVVYLCSL